MVWEFQNLGFGNRGLVTQRRGEQRQALVELFRIQDSIAAEVAQAHAQVEAAAVRVRKAEAGLKAAVASYEGNLKGLSETVRVGELLQLVNRPQEVVAALQQLQQAYINYYTSANDYNRAQFRLFRATGVPGPDPGLRRLVRTRRCRWTSPARRRWLRFPSRPRIATARADAPTAAGRRGDHPPWRAPTFTSSNVRFRHPLAAVVSLMVPPHPGRLFHRADDRGKILVATGDGLAGVLRDAYLLGGRRGRHRDR